MTASHFSNLWPDTPSAWKKLYLLVFTFFFILNIYSAGGQLCTIDEVPHYLLLESTSEGFLYAESFDLDSGFKNLTRRTCGGQPRRLEGVGFRKPQHGVFGGAGAEWDDTVLKFPGERFIPDKPKLVHLYQEHSGAFPLR
jgi:hypothetical protein